jgi:nitroimidazol reductase NimA-like FMN-containing flavoprotein (pyridoxamine 5'-phosphate oxidase superfamily)
MAGISNHEIVSIYPFDDQQLDTLMTDATECVLMWATQDSWPVGVYHSFVWKDGKIWITFAAHRHRTAAIRRNPKVSVAVSGIACRTPGSPRGSATAKGRAIIHEDAETKSWFYRALADKSNPGNPAGADDFVLRLDSPLRVILEIVPEKWITFDSAKSAADVAGTLSAEQRGPRQESDAVRYARELARRGLA